MKMFHLVLIPGLVMAWLVSAPSNAKEPDPPVDSVLAKWEGASQKCRTLDAKLAVLRYDAFNRDRPRTSWGRFYYEAPNVGRYEIRRYEIREGGGGNVNNWSALPEVWIWNGKEMLLIDGPKRTCSRFPLAKSQTLQDKPEGKKLMASFIAAFVRRLQSPQECLPLVVDIRAADVRKRFDVTIERSDEDILLKAVPKGRSDLDIYREIGVIVNAKTHLTSAIQVVDPDARGRAVFQLTEQKVNQRPSDRDQLIAPDLSGFRVTEELWECPRQSVSAPLPAAVKR